MRVLVTGSRDWTDEEVMRRVLSEYPPDTLLRHGDAPGADRMAARIGLELGHVVEAWPADWEKYGKGAGPIRNQQMVDAGADICLAFPTATSKGTWDCVRRCTEAGIVTRVWQPEMVYEV